MHLLLLTLLYFLPNTGLSSVLAPEPDRPNFVWITVEDLSPHFASYGDSTVATPNVDRLAQEGVRFTRFFATVPVCAPARSSIVTGMYPTSYGALHMRTMSRPADAGDALAAVPPYEAVPPAGARMLPEYLRMHGYYAVNNAKEDYQFRAPETAWDESSRRAHWRNRPDPEQPFFAVFNLDDTHESRVWQRADEPLAVDPDSVDLPPYYPDTPVIRRDVARHYTNIQSMDRRVGELLRQLEDDGLLEETIVIFFSDHGDGLPRAKRSLHDSGLHVPFIVRWPEKRDAGTADHDLHSFVDIAPTILSLANVSIPDHMQGRVFLGSDRSAPHDYVFGATGRMDEAFDNSRAVRDKRFKYIYNYHPDRTAAAFLPYRYQMPLMKELVRLNEEGRLQGPERLWFRPTKPREELYDTLNDPHEINDLAGDPAYAVRLEEMRARLVEWQEDTGDIGLIPEIELVRLLWPPDGVQPRTAEVEVDHGGTRFTGSTRVVLSSDTEGASIGYRFDPEEPWQVYVQPFYVTASGTLYVHAHRIGFEPSLTRAIEFERTTR